MLKAIKLNKTYNDKIALKDLNLTVAPGEIFCLLGQNGAGKTTTINIFLGVLEPTSGKALIDDISVTNNKKIRSSIAYIPESVQLYDNLSGVENLDFFSRLAGFKYSSEELKSYLQQANLQEEAYTNKLSSYSKGMRQKVGIAIAYAKKAEVYLLDEPASGLDPLASNELSELLKKLASEGAAILMASHDIFRVREVCNRIGILKKGVLVKQLSSAEVSANELEQLYLEFMKN